MVTRSRNPGSVVWARLFELPWWPALVLDPNEFSNETHPSIALPPSKCIVRLINHPSQPTQVSVRDLRPFLSDAFTEQQLSNVDQHSSRISSAVQIALNLTMRERMNVPVSASNKSPSSTPSQKPGSFAVGTVLWVYLPGFPWWPARIIEKSECNFASLRIDKIPSNQVLVMFFNDNNRFCLAEKDKTSPFCRDEFYETRLRYRGRHAYNVTRAVKEAWRFLENGPVSLVISKDDSSTSKRKPSVSEPIHQRYKRKRPSILSDAIETNIATPSVHPNEPITSNQDVLEVLTTNSTPKDVQAANLLPSDELGATKEELSKRKFLGTHLSPAQNSCRPNVDQEDQPMFEGMCSNSDVVNGSAIPMSETNLAGLPNTDGKNTPAETKLESRPLRKRSNWASRCPQPKMGQIPPTLSSASGSEGGKSTSEGDRPTTKLFGAKQPVKSSCNDRGVTFVDGEQETGRKIGTPIQPNGKTLKGKLGSSVTSDSVSQGRLNSLQNTTSFTRSGVLVGGLDSVKSNVTLTPATEVIKDLGDKNLKLRRDGAFARYRSERTEFGARPEFVHESQTNIPATSSADGPANQGMKIGGCAYGERQAEMDAPDIVDLSIDSEVDPLPCSPFVKRKAMASERFCGVCTSSQENTDRPGKPVVVQKGTLDACSDRTTIGHNISKRLRTMSQESDEEDRIKVTPSGIPLSAENNGREAENSDARSNLGHPNLEIAENVGDAGVESFRGRDSAAGSVSKRRRYSRATTFEEVGDEVKIDNRFENIPLGHGQARSNTSVEPKVENRLRNGDRTESDVEARKVGVVSNGANRLPIVGNEIRRVSCELNDGCPTCGCSNYINSATTRRHRNKRQKALSKSIKHLIQAVQELQCIVESGCSSADDDEVV